MKGEPLPAPLDLYLAAVQDPVTQVRVLERIFARVRPGQVARVLREDFAGTCADSVAWVARGPRRFAVAVERDAATLSYARHRAAILLRGRVGRLRFVEADVLGMRDRGLPLADLLCALNFSAYGLHSTAQMRGYFRRSLRALGENGVFVMNAFGGPGAMTPGLVRRRVKPKPAGPALTAFAALWELRAYDALRNRGDFRLHFEIDARRPGGRKRVLRDVFAYDWRLWTLPELVELMADAGFRRVEVWRHFTSVKKGRQKVFLGPVEAIPDLETWVAYVVGVR